jgi:hypothetical protein
LPLVALLAVGLAAVSLALGQGTNTPAGVAGGDTNSQEKFTPPSSNSFSFQETNENAKPRCLRLSGKSANLLPNQVESPMKRKIFCSDCWYREASAFKGFRV